MSNFDILPSINYISIQNDDDSIKPDSAKIHLYKSKGNDILFSFVISGLTKLNYPITGNNVPFYLFTAITFQNGGIEYEIISLSDIFVDEELLSNEMIKFEGRLNIPGSKVYENDFVNNVYYFTIAHTHKEITSEKEMNYLLSPIGSTLFRTKLNIEIKE